MKVLVTGGAGFLGSHLADALVEQGDEVIVLDNLHRGRLQHLRSRLDTNQITLLTEDIRDYPSVMVAMAGAEVVYHLAAQSNVMGAMHDIDYSFTTNVVGTFNVLKAAAAQGVRRVVFASSREVYGEPERLPVTEDAPLTAKNPYGASKVAAEAYCRAWQRVSGLECFVLRFANIYGPRDRDRVIPLWLDRAERGEDLELYGGRQVLDFLWVGHAVAALSAAAHRPADGPVNVGSGQGVPLVDLAQHILALTRSRSVIRYRPAREAEVVRFVADVSEMRGVLGVQPPETPLAGLTLMSSPEDIRIGEALGG